MTGIAFFFRKIFQFFWPLIVLIVAESLGYVVSMALYTFANMENIGVGGEKTNHYWWLFALLQGIGIGTIMVILIRNIRLLFRESLGRKSVEISMIVGVFLCTIPLSILIADNLVTARFSTSLGFYSHVLVSSRIDMFINVSVYVLCLFFILYAALLSYRKRLWGIGALGHPIWSGSNLLALSFLLMVLYVLFGTFMDGVSHGFPNPITYLFPFDGSLLVHLLFYFSFFFLINAHFVFNDSKSGPYK